MTDVELITSFEKSNIPKLLWNHILHLRVAFIYSNTKKLDRAIIKMRRGIQSLNKEHNTPETPSRGYNETLTQAWIRIVFKRVKNGNYQDSINFLKHERDLLNPGYLEKYYDTNSLKTMQAKRTFIEPQKALN